MMLYDDFDVNLPQIDPLDPLFLTLLTLLTLFSSLASTNAVTTVLGIVLSWSTLRCPIFRADYHTFGCVVSKMELQAAAIDSINEAGSTDPTDPADPADPTNVAFSDFSTRGALTGKGGNITRDRPGTVQLLEDPDLSDDDIEFSC